MLTLQTSFIIERTEVQNIYLLKDTSMPSREVYKRLLPNEKIVIGSKYWVDEFGEVKFLDSPAALNKIKETNPIKNLYEEWLNLQVKPQLTVFSLPKECEMILVTLCLRLTRCLQTYILRYRLNSKIFSYDEVEIPLSEISGVYSNIYYSSIDAMFKQLADSIAKDNINNKIRNCDACAVGNVNADVGIFHSPSCFLWQVCRGEEIVRKLECLFCCFPNLFQLKLNTVIYHLSVKDADEIYEVVRINKLNLTARLRNIKNDFIYESPLNDLGDLAEEFRVVKFTEGKFYHYPKFIKHASKNMNVNIAESHALTNPTYSKALIAGGKLPINGNASDGNLDNGRYIGNGFQRSISSQPKVQSNAPTESAPLFVTPPPVVDSSTARISEVLSQFEKSRFKVHDIISTVISHFPNNNTGANIRLNLLMGRLNSAFDPPLKDQLKSICTNFPKLLISPRLISLLELFPDLFSVSYANASPSKTKKDEIDIYGCENEKLAPLLALKDSIGKNRQCLDRSLFQLKNTILQEKSILAAHNLNNNDYVTSDETMLKRLVAIFRIIPGESRELVYNLLRYFVSRLNSTKYSNANHIFKPNFIPLCVLIETSNFQPSLKSQLLKLHEADLILEPRARSLFLSLPLIFQLQTDKNVDSVGLANKYINLDVLAELSKLVSAKDFESNNQIYNGEISPIVSLASSESQLSTISSGLQELKLPSPSISTHKDLLISRAVSNFEKDSLLDERFNVDMKNFFQIFPGWVNKLICSVFNMDHLHYLEQIIFDAGKPMYFLFNTESTMHDDIQSEGIKTKEIDHDSLFNKISGEGLLKSIEEACKSFRSHANNIKWYATNRIIAQEDVSSIYTALLHKDFKFLQISDTSSFKFNFAFIKTFNNIAVGLKCSISKYNADDFELTAKKLMEIVDNKSVLFVGEVYNISMNLFFPLFAKLFSNQDPQSILFDPQTVFDLSDISQLQAPYRTISVSDLNLQAKMITSSISYANAALMVSNLYRDEFMALKFAKKNNVNLKLAAINKCDIFSMEEEKSTMEELKYANYFPDVFQVIIQISSKASAKSTETKCIDFTKELEFRIICIDNSK